MATFFTMNADITDFTEGALVGKNGTRVRFDLNIKDGDMVSISDSPRPVLVDATKPIIGYIRSDGRMYNAPAVSAAPFDLTDPGQLGVRLLASTPSVNVTGGVTYRVTFEQVVNGETVQFRSFVTTTVPSTDTAVNLATFAPAPRGVDQ